MFLLIANFKSNKTSAEVETWLAEVAPAAKSAVNLEIVVAPSFPHLHLMSNILNTNPHIRLCAQDVSPFPYGSYTGAVNAAQLKDLSVSYAIIGHSERRRYFHEGSQEIANKASELVAVGITPILCMDRGDIAGQMAALDVDKSKLIFAFEPAGDIGGVKTASLDEIKEITSQIRHISPKSKVIYGGSVNSDDVKPLLSTQIEGSIIGTACLNPHDFIDLIKVLA